MSSFRCSLISILFKGTCDKYRLCVFGQVTSLQDRFLMLFSIKEWEVYLQVFFGQVERFW